MAHAMTPHDALRALSDLPHYEERLEVRTGGLTCMLWGLAIAGIFMTYTAAADLLEQAEADWAFSLLWVPWVLAGSALSGLLWRSNAIALRRPVDGRPGYVISAVTTLAYIAFAALLFLGLDVLAGLEWTVHSVMTVASGLMALLLATWQRRAWGPGARNVAVAGVAMVLAGIALGLSGVGDTGAGLLASAVTGVAWFGAGIATYRLG